MASFTTEFVVCDEKALKGHWGGIGRKAFFCAFCGHQFQIGDYYRTVYTNDMPRAFGNPLTCRGCWVASDGADGLREKWAALWEEYRTRFKWWSIRRFVNW